MCWLSVWLTDCCYAVHPKQNWLLYNPHLSQQWQLWIQSVGLGFCLSGAPAAACHHETGRAGRRPLKRHLHYSRQDEKRVVVRQWAFIAASLGGATWLEQNLKPTRRPTAAAMRLEAHSRANLNTALRGRLRGRF